MQSKPCCRSCGSPHLAIKVKSNQEPLCGCCAWKFKALFLPPDADLFHKLGFLLPMLGRDPGLTP